MGKVYKIRDLYVDLIKEKQVSLAKESSKIFSESEIIHAAIAYSLDKLTDEQIEEYSKKK